MKTNASILVNGVKQKFYFYNTVFLESNTEFEIEFFNKSQRTVCPSLTINGEKLSRSPVIYNGQRFILKDFISDNRRLLFKVYEVDSNDEDVKEAIKENGIISITYYYEKTIVEKIKHDLNADENVDYDPADADYDLPSQEETGKIMKGSPSGVSYNSIRINLDYSSSETQVIKILPLSKKPSSIICPQCQYRSRIDANYCEECGHNYLSKPLEDYLP